MTKVNPSFYLNEGQNCCIIMDLAGTETLRSKPVLGTSSGLCSPYRALHSPEISTNRSCVGFR